MGGTGVKSGEVVVVAVDASKEITDYALQWAVRNVVKPDDTLLLLALIKSSAASMLASAGWASPLASPGKLQLHATASNRNNQSGLHQLFTSWLKKWGRQDGSNPRRGKGVHEGLIQRIHEVCVEMMNELCLENNVKCVQTHVIVTVVPTAHIGFIADKADEYQARWLILDRMLKKESGSCLTHLNCNIILIDRAIPKILQVIDASPTEEESDVFTVRHRSNDSTTTSSGQDHDASFNISGSLGSSIDMDSVTPPDRMTTRELPPASPVRHLNFNTVTERQEQPTVPTRSRTPSKVTDKKIGGAMKASSHGRSSSDSRCRIQSSEILNETKPPADDGETVFEVGRRNDESTPISRPQGHELGSNMSGSLVAAASTVVARGFSPSRPSHYPYSNSITGDKEQRAVPAVSSFDNPHMFAKPPIPTKGTNKNFGGKQDAFSQVRKSVDSRSAIQRSSEIPSETKHPPTALRRNTNFKHVIEVVEPTAPPPIDRMSSVRKSMSLSIKKPPISPPLCSVCRHRAPVFGKPPRKFSHQEVERATDGFAAANFLAEGGYGTVYRGVLEDGQVVAVKQHKKASAQGGSEFCSEVEVLSCAQHRNLVMLIGYCMDKEWLLVYEFVCNGSLEKHLHGNGMEEVMAWNHRLKVAVGAARGLRYLHEDCRMGCIVHRDFRPNNILLTHDFEPMVGDFGLARWQVDGQSAEETRIVGTFGYLAPEYTQTGQITEKADVYAFGVLLMELISGVKAIDLARCTGQQSLSQWASSLMDRDMMHRLMDPRLNGNYVEQEVECMMFVAGLCISPDPESRPRMSKVLRMLEGDMPSGAAAHRHTQTPAAPFSPPRAAPGPAGASLFARTDQAARTRPRRKSSYSSYDEFAFAQRRGSPFVGEQPPIKNATKPPLSPQTFKVGIGEMKRSGDKQVLNENLQPVSKEYQAYLEDAVIDYIHRSRELATPKR